MRTLNAVPLSILDDDVSVHLLQHQPQRVAERGLHLRVGVGLVVREDQAASFAHDVHTDDASTHFFSAAATDRLLENTPTPDLGQSSKVFASFKCIPRACLSSINGSDPNK